MKSLKWTERLLLDLAEIGLLVSFYGKKYWFREVVKILHYQQVIRSTCYVFEVAARFVVSFFKC